MISDASLLSGSDWFRAVGSSDSVVAGCGVLLRPSCLSKQDILLLELIEGYERSKLAIFVMPVVNFNDVQHIC